MQSAAELNEHFAQSRKLSFREDPSGLVFADIDGDLARGSLCLQGAQVLTWQPQAEAHPVLWLSDGAKPARGKSIRGGIPICWPWFGPHELPGAYPAHGFARNLPWQVTQARVLDDASVQVCLRLPDFIAAPHARCDADSESVRALWPSRFGLELRATFGRTLLIELTTDNTCGSEILIGEALHTYLRVGDIGSVRVLGLEQCDFIDRVGPTTRKRQAGALSFDGEVDRVYIDSAPACVVDDPDLNRRIHILKSGSASTVVWTPWAEKAERMGDLGVGSHARGGWREMVCVESANALQNCVLLPPGAQHCLTVEYRVEPR